MAVKSALDKLGIHHVKVKLGEVEIMENITTEQRDHKIERAKELLLYDDLNLTEISYRLDYSSVAHLSSQFKKSPD